VESRKISSAEYGNGRRYSVLTNHLRISRLVLMTNRLLDGGQLGQIDSYTLFRLEWLRWMNSSCLWNFIQKI